MQFRCALARPVSHLDVELRRIIVINNQNQGRSRFRSWVYVVWEVAPNDFACRGFLPPNHPALVPNKLERTERLPFEVLFWIWRS